MFRGAKNRQRLKFWLKIDKNVHIFLIGINNDTYILEAHSQAKRVIFHPHFVCINAAIFLIGYFHQNLRGIFRHYPQYTYYQSSPLITRPLAGRAGRQRPLARVANVPLTTPWPTCADNQPTSPLLADDLADPPLANPHPTASSLSRGDLPPNPPNGAPAQWPMPMPGPQGSQPPPTPSLALKGRAN